MRKQTWILAIPLVLSIALTGCSIASGAEAEQTQSAQALDPAAWPTPQPSPVPASPTPFPKITLTPTTTPAARLTTASADAAPAQGFKFTGNVAELVQQVTQLSGGFPPVAAATIQSSGVNVRQEPSDSAASLGVAEEGELAAVLGRNEVGDWLYVLTRSALQGWLPADTLQITVALAETPILPPNPVPPKPARGDSSAGSAANPLGGLEPVAVALVTADRVTVRQGPASSYPSMGAVERGELAAVLGTNTTGDWLYIVTISVVQGWLPADTVRVTGSLAGAPVLPPNPLAVIQITPASSSIPASPGESVAATPSYQTVPAGPQASTSRQGKLVFQLSSGGDIMVINPDGTGLRRLTSGIDPVLSPDGQTVAFTRWAGESGSLWLINVDGSQQRHVLGETKKAKHPTWSPDGQRIVLNFQHGGRLEEKRVCKNLMVLGDKAPDIPFNAGDVETEIINGIPHLCWTLPPDPHWGLRVVNVADGSFEDMPSDDYAFGPEWDPANSWRVLSSGLNGLVQLDVNRNEQWALTDRREDHTPAFSPDGRYIAVAFNNNGQYDIHRLNSDGSGRVRLTETPLWVTAQPGKQKPWNNVSPAWSPDESQIAFLTDRTGRWEIWVMNADGSDQRPLFPESVGNQFSLQYNGVDERVLSWGGG